MKTELLNANNAADVTRAVELLRAGELVAVPTETVYGLAADASNPEAVKKIFAAKQRPSDHPLIVHIGDIEQLSHWAEDIPDWVYPLAEQFWPGPLTMIFKRLATVSPVINGGLPSVGIRMPNHPALLQLLQQANMAVAAPSANPYQKLSPTTAQQVLAGLDGKIAAVLDGGPCGVGTESTILKVENQQAQILRSGPINAVDLQPFFEQPIEMPRVHSEAVSGNKKVHYQPNAKVILCQPEQLQQLNNEDGQNAAALVYSSYQQLSCEHIVKLPADDAGYRKALYGTLHDLDKLGVSKIYVEMPPQQLQWLDILDRLSRAAAK
ncbi:L-threonylcarbamoyladenylate synthase [Thalassotalea maritima]|uniref:L-threonylcarbamoyladenylate synthase n=1 Tax=Thalassotalea maritima TaxID=3242416 RepID=UPI003527D512